MKDKKEGQRGKMKKENTRKKPQYGVSNYKEA
jgi:hypothetical protein